MRASCISQHTWQELSGIQYSTKRQRSTVSQSFPGRLALDAKVIHLGFAKDKSSRIKQLYAFHKFLAGYLHARERFCLRRSAPSLVPRRT
ncbi:uncharacterized protein CCR75_003306 [Bremia lactucae]|uniref:Uncharacterized protein n=1 Tax=Bremia lactucae TaxID=4779 RepID=A0A976NZN5_BRELC|nr:hypothetical protein CCR75_003306 [Bremia lactucae]